jgi:hypothetical protein
LVIPDRKPGCSLTQGRQADGRANAGTANQVDDPVAEIVPAVAVMVTSSTMVASVTSILFQVGGRLHRMVGCVLCMNRRSHSYRFESIGVSPFIGVVSNR